MARGQTQIVTTAPDGSNPRWLSQIGSYDGLKMSWSTPGGCNALSAVFRRPPRWRNDALTPGHLVRAFRGGHQAWDGVLDEPSPADSGWTITAHGAGGFPDDYLALYSVAWGTGVFNDAVDQAIARGMDVVRVTNIGALANIWTGQQVDSGAQTITNLLDLGCNKGGLTWQITTSPQGNLLTVFPLPTTPNRILISGNPESRSIDAGPSDLYLRYQATWDSATGNNPATYATTSVGNATDRALHGRREGFADLGSAGVMTAGAAQAVGNNVMKRWLRAGFADPFTIGQGELTTLGGQAVDLGSFWADGITAMVCKLWLADYSYGGEQTPGPAQFMAADYEYDEDADTATITPFENARHNFASLLQAAIDNTPVRTQPVARPKKKKKAHKGR